MERRMLLLRLATVAVPKFCFLSHGCHLRFQPRHFPFLMTQNKCKLSYSNTDLYLMEEGNILKELKDYSLGFLGKYFMDEDV